MTRIAMTDGWSYRAPQGPFAAVQGVSAAAIPVRLPHDAMRDAERRPDAPSKGASAYYPPVDVTYLNTFDVPESWAEKVVSLEIQGAYAHAMVFVNDELAGNRANGYARFFVDLTPYLKVGEENGLRVETRSGQDSRWYSGAGLYRPVVLHVNDLVDLTPDGVRITTIRVEDDHAVVEVATSVRNAGHTTATRTVTTVVRDAGGAEVEGDVTPITLPPGQTSVVRQRLYVQAPALWSVDRPNLYEAQVDAGGDAVVERFGIRTVTADPRKGLRINGEPVLMRGACIHHDNGPLGSAAIGRAEERRVELLKAAGFNAIRSAHNPVSVAMLDACDRLGMLVMDELTDMWGRGKTVHDYALDFPLWWAEDLSALVSKDYNHPSVVLYSLGNEIAEVGTPHGAVLARAMAETVRVLDPTRLVTNGVNMALAVMDELAEGVLLNEALGGDQAMDQLAMGESATRRTAESHSVLDVVGLNYAEGRYDLDRELFGHRVIVGSETFPSQIGRLWPMVVASPDVIGDFTWTGWDYLGEAGIGATAYQEDVDAVPGFEREFPFLTGWCGDLDITGFRRPVSYYREIVFGLRSEPYIAVRRPERHDHAITYQSPWAWSDSVSSWTWPGFEGRPVTVEVYADADEVALLVDGTEIARADVGVAKPKLAELETTYRPGELTAVTYRKGREHGRSTLRTVPLDSLRLTATADRTVLLDNDADLSYIAVELLGDGMLATGADRPVTVSVTGSGRLEGMCSANPKTLERFSDPTWRTFDGRALAVVRPTGAGTISVTCSAEGLAPVTVHLTVTASPAS
ncbi:MAG: glycoside hydrolase family 2 protein [Actinobacteria bacterium]|nr:glycoside hydrolase family 2 protein [Actinomycetota bacterium]